MLMIKIEFPFMNYWKHLNFKSGFLLILNERMVNEELLKVLEANKPVFSIMVFNKQRFIFDLCYIILFQNLLTSNFIKVTNRMSNQHQLSDQFTFLSIEMLRFYYFSFLISIFSINIWTHKSLTKNWFGNAGVNWMRVVRIIMPNISVFAVIQETISYKRKFLER